jgi:hypothetical protein
MGAAGEQGDAVLLLFDFFGDADDHDESFVSCRTVAD